MKSEIDILVEELLASVQPEYPKDHVAGMRVPKGGSSCAKCEYLADNKTDCTNGYFQKWNGGPEIPGKIDEYCSDWFEPKEDLEAAGTSEGVRKAWDTRGRKGPEVEMVQGVRKMTGEDAKALRDWRRLANRQIGGKQEKMSMRKAANVADWIADDWADEQVGSRTDKPSQFFVLNSPVNGIVGAMNIHDGGSSGYSHVSSLATRPDVIVGQVDERGVGTKLMIQAAKFAASRGHGLDLSALGGAEGFYRKLGMHETPAHIAGKGLPEFEWTPEEVKQMATGKVN